MKLSEFVYIAAHVLWTLYLAAWAIAISWEFISWVFQL